MEPHKEFPWRHSTDLLRSLPLGIHLAHPNVASITLEAFGWSFRGSIPKEHFHGAFQGAIPWSLLKNFPWSLRKDIP